MPIAELASVRAVALDAQRGVCVWVDTVSGSNTVMGQELTAAGQPIDSAFPVHTSAQPPAGSGACVCGRRHVRAAWDEPDLDAGASITRAFVELLAFSPQDAGAPCTLAAQCGTFSCIAGACGASGVGGGQGSGGGIAAAGGNTGSGGGLGGGASTGSGGASKRWRFGKRWRRRLLPQFAGGV